MDQTKADFISKKRIAVFGVSRSAQKFGNSTYRELKQRGYDVVAIHPDLESIDGDPVFKSLDEFSPTPEGAVISVSPNYVPDILRDLAKHDIKHVWLQQGSESPEASQVGKDLGLSMVEGGCILMYAEPVSSIHSVHRWIWKVLKKY
ncbi:MAG: CoA-binding protein [Anaerolineaceae bacterium]|nr:CoA-binding protein [Anaerolineaceae bacterium]